MAPSLQFLGAAGTVTGSRFLVDSGTSRVLVDAGLYQGPSELRRRNWEDLPFAPATIDAVVLTHAHLDHVGALPALVKQGFDGPVVCTAETAALAAIVLRDSARLQAEDARYANTSGFSKHSPALPLYDEADVERALPLLHPVAFHEVVPLTDDIDVVLRSAGHILGSATAELRMDGAAVLFSGDLGRPDHELVPDREPPPAVDTVVVESTYGDRQHPPATSSALADAVRRTIGRGGSVLVPAFAVDRTELVLLALGRLMRDGGIPTVPVYVDSPMALATLDVYRSSLGAAMPKDLGVPDLRRATTAQESARLNSPDRPCIVVSASGMAAGGRVTHHLAHQLPDPRNSVVLTGYQAVGTRGRALADGATHVKIHGRYVPVRAEVVHVEEFSVHADGGEIIEWLRQMRSPPRTVYTVHGEADASRALAARIETELGWCAVVPRYGERVRLD